MPKTFPKGVSTNGLPRTSVDFISSQLSLNGQPSSTDWSAEVRRRWNLDPPPFACWYSPLCHESLSQLSDSRFPSKTNSQSIESVVNALWNTYVISRAALNPDLSVLLLASPESIEDGDAAVAVDNNRSKRSKSDEISGTVDLGPVGRFRIRSNKYYQILPSWIPPEFGVKFCVWQRQNLVRREIDALCPQLGRQVYAMLDNHEVQGPNSEIVQLQTKTRIYSPALPQYVELEFKFSRITDETGHRNESAVLSAFLVHYIKPYQENDSFVTFKVLRQFTVFSLRTCRFRKKQVRSMISGDKLKKIQEFLFGVQRTRKRAKVIGFPDLKGHQSSDFAQMYEQVYLFPDTATAHGQILYVHLAITHGEVPSLSFAIRDAALRFYGSVSGEYESDTDSNTSNTSCDPSVIDLDVTSDGMSDRVVIDPDSVESLTHSPPRSVDKEPAFGVVTLDDATSKENTESESEFDKSMSTPVGVSAAKKRKLGDGSENKSPGNVDTKVKAQSPVPAPPNVTMKPGSGHRGDNSQPVAHPKTPPNLPSEQRLNRNGRPVENPSGHVRRLLRRVVYCKSQNLHPCDCELCEQRGNCSLPNYFNINTRRQPGSGPAVARPNVVPSSMMTSSGLGSLSAVHFLNNGEEVSYDEIGEDDLDSDEDDEASDSSDNISGVIQGRKFVLNDTISSNQSDDFVEEEEI